MFCIDKITTIENERIWLGDGTQAVKPDSGQTHPKRGRQSGSGRKHSNHSVHL